MRHKAPKRGLEGRLVARPKGFTLIETLMVIVVISLLGLMSIPKFQDAVAQGNLRSSRTRVMSLFATARATSMASGRATYLHLQGNRVYVTAAPRLAGAGTQDLSLIHI